VKLFQIILRFFQSFWTLLRFTLRQLYAQRGLTLAILLGLVTTTAIAMSIPIYADAVYQDVLETQLVNESEVDETYNRPPFAFMFRYVGSWQGPIAYEATLVEDEYLSGRAVTDLHLPLVSFTRYYKTTELRLFGGEESNYDNLRSSLAYVNFGSVSSLEEHIQLLEGHMPSKTPVDGVVEVLVTENFANELGLQSGEIYKVFERVQTQQGEIRVEIPVMVSGVWRAVDPNDPYWFYGLSWFDVVLLTDPEAFTQHVLPYSITRSTWHCGIW
jgi:putative ABC transport system permease protein